MVSEKLEVTLITRGCSLKARMFDTSELDERAKIQYAFSATVNRSDQPANRAACRRGTVRSIHTAQAMKATTGMNEYTCGAPFPPPIRNETRPMSAGPANPRSGNHRTATYMRAGKRT